MVEKGDYSMLVISPVEKEFDRVINLIKKFGDMTFIYVSANKTEDKMKNLLKNNNIDTKNMFFIDCFSSKNKDRNKISVDPSKLNMLLSAIEKFTISVKGDKVIIIDELSALAIYNAENEVAKFVKKLIENTTKRKAKMIVFMQKSNEHLIGLVFNFFDKVSR